jgi:hypothetical protein
LSSIPILGGLIDTQPSARSLLPHWKVEEQDVSSAPIGVAHEEAGVAAAKVDSRDAVRRLGSFTEFDFRHWIIR